jgi:hypothetical protein
VVGGHGAAIQHVVRHRGRCLSIIKFLADVVSGVDRVRRRYVVGDPLGLQQRDELVVVGVGSSGRDCKQRAE